MNNIRYMIDGMGYLEGYGTHPGTPMIIALNFVMVAIAIMETYTFGIVHMMLSILVSLAFMSPMTIFYLYGAWDRGRLYKIDSER